jgi:hypothetical protein
MSDNDGAESVIKLASRAHRVRNRAAAHLPAWRRPLGFGPRRTARDGHPGTFRQRHSCLTDVPGPALREGIIAARPPSGVRKSLRIRCETGIGEAVSRQISASQSSELACLAALSMPRSRFARGARLLRSEGVTRRGAPQAPGRSETGHRGGSDHEYAHARVYQRVERG